MGTGSLSAVMVEGIFSRSMSAFLWGDPDQDQ